MPSSCGHSFRRHRLDHRHLFYRIRFLFAFLVEQRMNYVPYIGQRGLEFAEGRSIVLEMLVAESLQTLKGLRDTGRGLSLP